MHKNIYVVCHVIIMFIVPQHITKNDFETERKYWLLYVYLHFPNLENKLSFTVRVRLVRFARKLNKKMVKSVLPRCVLIHHINKKLFLPKLAF
jgi:hypothetical protein